MVVAFLFFVPPATAGMLAIGDAGDLSTTSGTGIILTGGDGLTTLEDGLVLTDGDSSVPDTTDPTVPGDACHIFVNGDLFLDYSVFSTRQDLYISGNITLIGETITVFPPEQEPAMPDLSDVVMFQNPYALMPEAGDVLLFSHTPVLNGIFEATGSMTIGNYSSLTPVPLPASLLFFLSGLVAFGLKTGKTQGAASASFPGIGSTNGSSACPRPCI